MAGAHIQESVEVSQALGTTGTTSGFTVTAGNFLVLWIFGNDSNSITYTATDSKGNTWTQAVALGNAGPSRRVTLLYVAGCAGGVTNITVTASGTTTFRFLVSEFSGAETVSPVEATSSLAEVATTSHKCSADGTVIDTTVATIVCALSATGANFGAITPGSGYTSIGAAFSGNFGQWQIFSGPVSDERGAFVAGTGGCAAAIAAFKVAAALGQPTIRRYGGLPFARPWQPGVKVW